MPGSLWGRGQETFLAEDIVRVPFKTPLQLAVIGHLHIMLALIAVALTLILGRWFDFKGRLHKIAMPLMIAGTLIITGGVWAVVPFEAIAHMIINVGSFPGAGGVLAADLLRLAQDRADTTGGTRGIAQAGFGQRLSALLHDPLRFGMLWQMVYMNFVVTAVGIFMAIRLDEVIRKWPLREEQVALTGHWHILAGIIATIILLLYADLAGLKGRARQWFGWVVIVASDIAFAAVSLYETKRLFVSEAAQQPLVDAIMLVTDAALATTLVALAALLVWRLVDLFRRNGRWAREAAEAALETPKGEAAP